MLAAAGVPFAFASDAGWTSSNAERTLYAVEGELRLTRAGVTADRYASYSQITNLTSGAAYVLRAIMLAGKGVEGWALRAGSTAGNNDYLDSTRKSTAKARINAALADGALYSGTEKEILKALLLEQGRVQLALAQAESAWLEACEALETADRAGIY